MHFNDRIDTQHNNKEMSHSASRQSILCILMLFVVILSVVIFIVIAPISNINYVEVFTDRLIQKCFVIFIQTDFL